MKTLTALFTKVFLTGTILSLGFFSFPILNTYAAGLNDTPTPPAPAQQAFTRLQTAWSGVQKVYQAQGDLLTKAAGQISKVQALIDKANANGLDTSAVQAALTAFQSALKSAQSIHDGGASIISTHAGFDASGNVVDPTQAKTTVQSLHQVNQNTRSALNGTGKALIDAIKAFRQAHKPAPSGTPAPTNT
jgi:hypothetical protein